MTVSCRTSPFDESDRRFPAGAPLLYIGIIGRDIDMMICGLKHHPSMHPKETVLLARRLERVVGKRARLIWGTLFLAVVAACLCAGLWPFAPPANDAHWVPGQNALRFARYGTALSRTVLHFPTPEPSACTVEVFLRPRTPWTRGAPLSFYRRETGTSFEIQQVYADLQIALVKGKSGPDPQSSTLEIRDVFLKPEFLLTITSNGHQTSVYVNGELLLTSASLTLSSSDLSGLVILGNAPVRNRQWTGQVRGLAVYADELRPQTVLRHSADWANGVAPLSTGTDKPVALYLFRERDGRIVHDEGSSRADLDVPARYVTVDQIRFERPASEARDANYKSDAAFNVYGFIPLGFVGGLFFTCFLRRGLAAMAAIAIGFAVSLTIEYGQSFLPTRYSGTTDLFTNTLGTALGVLLCYGILWLIKKIWVEQLDAQPS